MVGREAIPVEVRPGLNGARTEERPLTSSANSNAPMTDEQIKAATVGERHAINSTISLVPYDPDWPSQFAHLEARVRRALGDKMLLLEHVGSTSVPGLSAKPIIDMVLAVADSRDEASYVSLVEERGFVLRIREPDWNEHRMLKSKDPAGNLHVFSEGCQEIQLMLFFRDWLRGHAEDRQLYEETKRELAGRTWKYTQNYADAKGDVIRGILAKVGRNQT
jgi:GrpB-like predicted nucleotidyltransferase (UPF0157 family)